MVFGRVNRFEWILVAATLVAISPFWVVGLRLVFLNSPVIESIFSVGLIGADLLLSVPFFVFIAALLIVAEALWLIYCLLSPGTLFDRELRWKKGMPYGRLAPHIVVLGIVLLTYGCRDMLHIQDTLAGIGKL
jgi:hypothetical protein